MKSAGTRGYSPLARVMTLAVMLLAMAATAWAQGTVTIKEGTADADKWTIKTGETTVTPTTEVAKDATITATYSGSKHVKSVTAVTKAAAPAAVDLDASNKAWADGSAFAVPAGGLTYSDAVTVSGNVTLTLTEGTTLTMNKGISLAEGATLTIDGTGTMNVNGTNNGPASTVAGTGMIVLTSGTLNAKGGNGQGLGDYCDEQNVSANVGGVAVNGNVTVSGGTLNATGGNGGSMGEYGVSCRTAAGGAAISGSVTVSSGASTATGGTGGSDNNYCAYAQAGAGGAAIAGDATINGGTWTATNGSAGAKRGDGSVGTGGAAVAGTVTDNRN